MIRFRNICIGKTVLALSAAAVLLTGCGGPSRSAAKQSYAVAETMAATAAPSYGGGSGAFMAKNRADGAVADMDYEEAEYAYEESGAGSSAQTPQAAPEPDQAEAAAAEAGTDLARKLIRNVDLALETKEYDAVVDNILGRLKSLGGYTQFMNSWGGSDGRNRGISITARIPMSKLDEFLDTAFEGAVIRNRTESTEDVTLRYSDLKAHIKSLRTEQERLLELMAKAEDVDAIIALESRLSEIRYEVESIEQSIRYLDNQVTYSTVNISLNEVSIISAPKKAGLSERITTGFEENLADLQEELEDLLVWFVTNLPRNILLLIVAIIVIRILAAISRRARKGPKLTRAEKKALKAEKKAAKAALKAEKAKAKAPSGQQAEETPAAPGEENGQQ